MAQDYSDVEAQLARALSRLETTVAASPWAGAGVSRLLPQDARLEIIPSPGVVAAIRQAQQAAQQHAGDQKMTLVRMRLVRLVLEAADERMRDLHTGLEFERRRLRQNVGQVVLTVLIVVAWSMIAWRDPQPSTVAPLFLCVPLLVQAAWNTAFSIQRVQHTSESLLRGAQDARALLYEMNAHGPLPEEFGESGVREAASDVSGTVALALRSLRLSSIPVRPSVRLLAEPDPGSFRKAPVEP